MDVWIHPKAWKEVKSLSGHVKQRVRRVIRDLAQEPRPAHSRRLLVPAEFASMSIEARRLRIDKWRVIYVIDNDWNAVIVLAIRKRPPYNYKDLPRLLQYL